MATSITGISSPQLARMQRERAFAIHGCVSGDRPHDENTELRSACSAFCVDRLDDRPRSPHGRSVGRASCDAGSAHQFLGAGLSRRMLDRS